MGYNISNGGRQSASIAPLLWGMNKNEFELEKLKISAERFHIIMVTIAKFLTITGWAAAIYLIMRSLETIVLAKPEAIQALALVIEKLNINSILGWVGTVMATGAWYYERKGKKRAYKVDSELRKQLERNDAHHGASGLDHNGHTPHR
jgi:hypothetical protein